MKRLGSLILVCLMALTLVLGVCGAAAETAAGNLAGGWFLEDMPKCELPENLAKYFDDNLELFGATYEPVLYLATQVVAGTNHMILCIENRVVENPGSGILAAVTIYEDLAGDLSVTSIKELDLTTFLESDG